MTALDYTIREYDPCLLPRIIDTILDIHLAAMNYPESERDLWREHWLTDAATPGYRLFLATSPPHAEPRLYGVASTLPPQRDSLWHSQVSGHLSFSEQPLPRNYTEFRQLHVDPRAQGHGIGKKLTNVALADEENVVLITVDNPDYEHSSESFHAAIGFTTHVRGVKILGSEYPNVIMMRQK